MPSYSKALLRIAVGIMVVGTSVVLQRSVVEPGREQIRTTSEQAIKATPASIITTTTIAPTTTTTLPPTTTTTQAPAPVKAMRSQTVQVVAPPGAGPTDEQLRQLRMCESGGNYQANTGNGYYGAYQFLPSTWRTMGTGYDLPTDAPSAVQDDAARRLIIRSGWGQFPACSRKMGMR